MARAHTKRRFLIAASDGAARTGPRAIRPVSCICGLGGAFRRASAQPRTAASMAATSIFFIGIIAANARLAASPP
jgi:hypothetical protein